MGRIITFSNALKEALSEEMARDEKVIMMGQDIGILGDRKSVV